jgi:hypothetical protein
MQSHSYSRKEQLRRHQRHSLSRSNEISQPLFHKFLLLTANFSFHVDCPLHESRISDVTLPCKWNYVIRVSNMHFLNDHPIFYWSPILLGLIQSSPRWGCQHGRPCCTWYLICLDLRRYPDIYEDLNL